MKKQLIFAGAGVVIIAILFFFGRTTEPKKPMPQMEAKVQAFDIKGFMQNEKQKLSPSQAIYLTSLENNISRGDIPAQKVEALNSIAAFWKDSVRQFECYAYNISEAAKLDNSEKSLTFAAQLFLENLRGEQDVAKLDWMTAEAISLFEKAIALNPNNDDLKIGLGSCYIYGKGRSGDPQQTMRGVQELLGVVRKDSNNMKAQLVLGVGGYLSGQYDKAIARLSKVVIAEPENFEAIAFLADTYAAKGDNESAVKWYEISKRLNPDPAYIKAVDERIKTLTK